MENINTQVEESKKMLEVAKQLHASDSPNKVYSTIDSVGSIQAYVFGPQGIVSATPCYDDQEAGKFGTRLAYPQTEKILQYYSQQTGVSADSVSLVDDNFIDFSLNLFSMEDNGWELTHASWDHSYSGSYGILYDSMQEAIESMYSDDVFCQLSETNSKQK